MVPEQIFLVSGRHYGLCLIEMLYIQMIVLNCMGHMKDLHSETSSGKILKTENFLKMIIPLEEIGELFFWIHLLVFLKYLRISWVKVFGCYWLIWNHFLFILRFETWWDQIAGRGTSPSNLQSIVKPMFFVSHLKRKWCLNLSSVFNNRSWSIEMADDLRRGVADTELV